MDHHLWAERPYLATAIVALGTLLLYGLIKMHRVRRVYAELAKRGLPMPPNNFFLGHVQTVAEVMKNHPVDAYKNYIFGTIATSFSERAAYLDLWPFSDPILILANPSMADQATVSTSLAVNKPLALKVWMRSLAGGITMFDAPDPVWKPLRALFNTGFSSTSILSLVPSIVGEVETYQEMLTKRAQEGKMFFMDELTLRLTIDITGHTVLNAHFNSQRTKNLLAETLLDQVECKIANQEVNPLQWADVFRMLREWRNGRIMDRLVGEELDKRFASMRSDSIDEGSHLSIMDKFLHAYMTDHSANTDDAMDKSYRTFRTDAIRNIRMFLFVGHDSTSSAICYVYYLLSRHPASASFVREELDAVFGQDTRRTATLLTENPRLIDQLPYTQAVIKETLRLFPPAGCVRDGRPGIELVDDQGKRYPTEGCILFVPHYFIHRSPDIWPYPNEFRPERWLVEAGHELYPGVKGAYRPFEQGPRKCVAEVLVTRVVRTVLALTLREFDISPAYEEFDRLNPSKSHKHMFGERAYLKEAGAAHPADHFPCRVQLRKSGTALDRTNE